MDKNEERERQLKAAGSDPTNPDYYKSDKIECIDAIECAVEGLSGIEAFCTGNAIKYLWRWKKKNGKEDIRKAIWYLDRISK